MSQPISDVICVLKEIPASKWTEGHRSDLIVHGRPTPSLPNLVSWDRKLDRLYKRVFLLEYYDVHPWLCASHYEQKLYCWPCIVIGYVENSTNLWIGAGVSDMKNVVKNARIHEICKDHLSNYIALNRLEKLYKSPILQNALQECSQLVKDDLKRKVKLNRTIVDWAINLTVNLVQQGVCVTRSDNQTFETLLNVSLSGNPDLKYHFKNTDSFFGGMEEFQNTKIALINCAAEQISEMSKKHIAWSNFYSVEIHDVTDIVQPLGLGLAISVRYMTDNYSVAERFLGLYSSIRNSADLVQLLENVLKDLDAKHKLVGLTVDGAVLPMSEFDVLRVTIRDSFPSVTLLHSYTHNIPLLLFQSCALTIPECRIYFGTLFQLSSFFRSSSLDPSIETRLLQARRWISRSLLPSLVIDEWSELKTLFETLSETSTSNDSIIWGASSFLKHFSDFDFAFLSLVFNDVILFTGELSEAVGKKFLDMNGCQRKAESCCEKLEIAASSFSVGKYMKEAAEMTSTRWIDVKDHETTYQHLYIEIVKNISAQITGRYCRFKDFKFLQLSACRNADKYFSTETNDIMITLRKVYGYQFTNMQRFKNEIEVVYTDDELRYSTNVHDLTKMMRAHKMDDILKEAFKFFYLLAVLPTTNPSYFGNDDYVPCSKKIRIYLRSTIDHLHLDQLASHLAIIAMSKDFFHPSKTFYQNIRNKLTEQRINIDLEFKNN